MKGTEYHRQILPHQGDKPLTHLHGGRPGKGNHQNFFRRHLMPVNQMPDAAGQRVGFPAARTRQRQAGPRKMGHCLLL